MSVFQEFLTSYFDSIYQAMVADRLRGQVELTEPGKNGLHLDLGCHAGENSVRLADAAAVSSTWGLDYDADLLRTARKERAVRAIQADLNGGLPLRSGSFDLVTAMDVLEHLVNTAGFLGEIHRVLRPGGYAIIATPNLAAWHNVFALVLGLQPFSGPNIGDMTDGEIDLVRRLHRRAYNMPEDGEVARPEGAETVHRHLVVVAYRSLVRLLQEKGFVVEVAWGFGYYPLPHFLAKHVAKLDKRHSVHLLFKLRKPAVVAGRE